MTASTSLAPIALFVQRRPQHTRKALDSLRADPLARESDLVVFADAAKKPEHEAGVREVREIIARIDGFRSVEVVARDRNLGLAASISDGVGRLTRERGRVIVVEDDLVVSPHFLSFLNRGLDVYACTERVYQVSGYMYPGSYGGATDAVFLPMISCWGWGTWRRAWEYYDPTLAGFERIGADPSLKARLNLNGAYDYFTMAKQQRDGNIDSWGICWHMSVFQRDGLALYPRQTFVRNDGFDASGTHGAGNEGLHSALWDPPCSIETLRLPSRIEEDRGALSRLEALLRAQRPGLMDRVVGKLRGWLKP